MTKNNLKPLAWLFVMLICIGIALFSKHYLYYKLFASLAIITAALAAHFASRKQHLKHD